jgi:hypothetical protein
MYWAVKNTKSAGITIKHKIKIISVPAGKIAKGEINVSKSIGQRYNPFVEKFMQNPTRIT